nr:hypothetical protein [Tanacetum cinerariifolium]
MNQNFLKPNPCYEPNSSSFDQYQPLQSFVTQQIPQRLNEDIRLEMAKLIKNNRILLNNIIFPHEETRMELLNDSRAIDEMLKQREQAANLAVQQEQDEQAAQIFTPHWNFSVIDDEENCPTFYDNDEEHSIQHKEYLDNSSNAIATVLPTKEPEYSFRMRYKHLSTILETESDEVIKSSAKNLVQFPSEYEVTSDDESECDVPVKDESSQIFTTFSNPLFDCNDDSTSSDDESLSNEDVRMENFKREHEEYISLMEKLLAISSFPRPLENFHANSIIETLPTSPIPVEDSDSFREEINIFTGTDDLTPQGSNSDDYDSERDIHFLEELPGNDSIPLPENESSNFHHHDDPSFPRPPPEPPDVEFFFDFEPNSGKLVSAVMNNINELIEDECFDSGGGEIDVFENIKYDDYFPFIFVIRIFLPYLTYPEVSPLLLSTGSENTIFDPGIST